MKYASLLLATALGTLATPVFAQQTDLSTDAAKTSYAIGQQIGTGLKGTGMPIDITVLTQSLTEALAGKPARLTAEETERLMIAFQQAVQARQTEMKQQAGAAAAAEGKAFLDANAKKSGVKTLPSGLQYQVEKLGNGPSPLPSDQVRVHYRGTLLNGQEFDSSYKRGEPAQFGVGQVIKGWTEALQRMRTGAKWKLFIPAELAYGANGAGADIPPNATLIFEVELLEVVGKKADVK